VTHRRCACFRRRRTHLLILFPAGLTSSGKGVDTQGCLDLQRTRYFTATNFANYLIEQHQAVRISSYSWRITAVSVGSNILFFTALAVSRGVPFSVILIQPAIHSVPSTITTSPSSNLGVAPPEASHCQRNWCFDNFTGLAVLFSFQTSLLKGKV